MTHNISCALRAYTGKMVSVLCLLMILSACNTDVADPVSLEHKDSELFVRLEMNHRAVLLSTIAPYDTFRLSTIPLGENDSLWKPSGLSQNEIDSIIAANPPTFISRDSTRVKVTNDGLLKAIKATTNTGTVQIIATQQINNVTRACTTLVRALPIENPLPAKRIIVSSVDSLKVAARSSAPLLIQVFDEDDNVIENVVTYVQSLNPKVIRIASTASNTWNATTVSGNTEDIGTATVRVTALAFGKEVSGEISIRNGYPLIVSSINLGQAFHYVWPYLGDVVIAKGGIVSWANDTIAGVPDVAIDLIFDDPDAVSAAPLPSQNSGSGNIYWPIGDRNETVAQRTRYRQFNIPGVYVYRISPRTNSGRVIVKEF